MIVLMSFVIIIFLPKLSRFKFQEFPFVRYKKPSKEGDDDSKNSRDLIPKKLAEAVWKHITTYKTSIPKFPATETCELLIVDRSIDQVPKAQFTTLYLLKNNLFLVFIILLDISRSLPSYMNGRTMLCVMIYLSWKEINMYTR